MFNKGWLALLLGAVYSLQRMAIDNNGGCTMHILITGRDKRIINHAACYMFDKLLVQQRLKAV